MKRLSMLFLLASCAAVAQTTLYKSVDAQGNVTFSDTPPVDGAAADPIEISDTPANVLPSENIQEAMEEQQQADQRAAREQQAARQDWNQRYATAKAELEEAEKNLASAQQIKEGDTVGSAFGGARPNQKWIENLEQAERDVEEKQAALDKVRRERR